MALVNTGPLAGGGTQTTVDGAAGYGLPGIGGGVGLPGDMGWMMALARRRAEQKAHLGDIESAAAEQALRRSQAPTNQGGISGPDWQEQQLRMFALRDARAQNEARTGAPPIVGITAPYQQGVRYETNPLAMNSYQRQVFMPQSNVAAMAGPSPASLEPSRPAVPDLGGGIGGDIQSYLNSLRMYQPDRYAQAVAGLNSGRK